MKTNMLIKIGDFIKTKEGEVFKITNIEQSFHGMFILSLRNKDNRRYVTEAYSLEWNDILNIKRFEKVEGF